MKTTVTKIASNGVEITVKWSASMVDRDIDGVVYGQDAVSTCDSIELKKDGAEIIKTTWGAAALLTSYANMPTAAKAVIRGYKAGKEIVQPIGAETYEIILAAIKEAKKQAESDIKTTSDGEKEPALAINPDYAGLSRLELKQKEKDYDDLYNEGCEGFNPYRDNLYIADGGEK